MIFKIGFMLYFVFGSNEKYKDTHNSTLKIGKSLFLPTLSPTTYPTVIPTSFPTQLSLFPTESPTFSPTASPTPSPTKKPSPSPTQKPSSLPTPKPSSLPTASPTPYPTRKPTPYPTPSPTSSPTPSPTPSPTQYPTSYPTLMPTLYLTTVFSVPGAISTEIVSSTSSYAVGTYYTSSTSSPKAFVYNYNDGSYIDLYVPGNELPGWKPYSTGTDIVGDTVFFDTAWRVSFSKNLKTGVTTAIHPNEYPGYQDAGITSVDPTNPQQRVGQYYTNGATVVNSFYTDGTKFIQLKSPNPDPDKFGYSYVSYYAKGTHNGNVVGSVGNCCSGILISSAYNIGWFWNGKTYLEEGIKLPSSFGIFKYCGASDIYDDYIIGYCESKNFIYKISSKTYHLITSNIPDAAISINSIVVSPAKEIILTGSYKLNNDNISRGFRSVLDKNYLIMLSYDNHSTNRVLIEDTPVKTYLRKRNI